MKNIKANIMHLISKRIKRDPEYTISELSVDNVFICNVLEDTDRGLTDSMTAQEIESKKIYGKTAIPTGTYTIDMDTVSPKFESRSWAVPYQGKLPRLQNVKGFEGVLIHVGNKAEDTLGCLLVGTYNGGNNIVQSTIAFLKLMGMLLQAHQNQEEIKITIC